MVDLNIIQTIEKANLMMKTGELELYKKNKYNSKNLKE